ncbi:MAG: double-strand break repair protein AddB [Rhodospirillaceae bacterium]|nr:double-strand break repair protein AddB [Rhodospirillaceae bacterium]
MTTEKRGPSIYNMPASVPFIEALISGIYSEKIFNIDRKDPLWLNNIIILLPTRRACRSLEENFIRLSNRSSLLLPKIFPIGDIENNDPEFGNLETIIHRNLPRAISPIRRQLLLAKLIKAWSINNTKISVEKTSTWSIENVMRLANELTKLIDSAEIEEVSFSKLKDLAPHEFAHHWQNTIRFLDIVTNAWPDILSEEGLIDTVTRRNLAIHHICDFWEKSKPQNPIIIAGSTGSIPAVARLMKTVSYLPNGMILLPGLDKELSSNNWESITPSHPQFTLKTLLKRLSIKRSNVKTWPTALCFNHNSSRSKMLSEALKPPKTNNAIPNFQLDHDAIKNITIVECADTREEAGLIALRMRAALDEISTSGNKAKSGRLKNRRLKTIALITADRQLAHQVAVELTKWNITVDDSAGKPINQTLEGSLLQLTSKFFIKDLGTVDLLAALKHPLASGGIIPEKFREFTQEFEACYLRKVQPISGFFALKNLPTDYFPDKEMQLWTKGIFNILKTCSDILVSEKEDFFKILCTHIRASEWLASNYDSDGSNLLFGSIAGKELALFLEELLEHGDSIGKINGTDYISIFNSLIKQHMIRPKFENQNNFFIWSPLEARLQKSDIVIIGGLNEGTWPLKPKNDPWMNRPMREAFGLASPEKRIGLSAHDFVQAASTEQVMITRSQKNNDGPTIPSRWFLRIINLLEKNSSVLPKEKGEYWKSIYHEQQKSVGNFSPISPPSPIPPLDSRPRKLSVTEVERWMKDPYSIYAKHILRLRPMEPINLSISNADKGNIIHEILDTFLKNNSSNFSDDSYEKLIIIGQQVFKSKDLELAKLGLWWPRFERIAKWFVKNEINRQFKVNTLGSELLGDFKIARPGGIFHITGKADRIDKMPDGTLSIIDYKTGRTPSIREMREGKAPQLFLEALIAEAGGFANISNTSVSELAYWRLSGGEPAGEITKINDGIKELITQTLQNLETLIDTFDKFETPYLAQPRHNWSAIWSDYTHLSRINEWSIKVNKSDEND